jgi:hypothetical protein
MKFFMVVDAEPSKLGDMATASDKFWNNPPKGVKKLAQYTLLAPLPGQDQSRVHFIAVLEVENEQALQSIEYGLVLLGASVMAIPVAEMSAAPELEKLEQELKLQASKE